MSRRKQIEFDRETFIALTDLAADRMATMQELADEAFTDLLRKHHRPVGLKAALKQSAAKDGNNDNAAPLRPGGSARDKKARPRRGRR